MSDHRPLAEYRHGGFKGLELNQFEKHFLKPKVVSNGGKTSYYDLPTDAKDLNDLIEAKHMSFARANIFKAVFRMSEKAGTDTEYDINKIILFAERLRGMARKGLPL